MVPLQVAGELCDAKKCRVGRADGLSVVAAPQTPATGAVLPHFAAAAAAEAPDDEAAGELLLHFAHCAASELATTHTLADCCVSAAPRTPARPSSARQTVHVPKLNLSVANACGNGAPTAAGGMASGVRPTAAASSAGVLGEPMVPRALLARALQSRAAPAGSPQAALPGELLAALQHLYQVHAAGASVPAPAATCWPRHAQSVRVQTTLAVRHDETYLSTPDCILLVYNYAQRVCCYSHVSPTLPVSSEELGAPDVDFGS